MSFGCCNLCLPVTRISQFYDVCDGGYDYDAQLGPSTVCETMIQGTKVSLLELQLKILHTLISPLQSGQARPKPAGRIALIIGSNLQSRHRLTMESTFGYTTKTMSLLHDVHFKSFKILQVR